MSNQPPSAILAKIAFYQDRRDEIPNQQLARELAETRNEPGIAEIAAHLQDKHKNIQSDCLKVLYEIGYLVPELIADYANDFLQLLSSKNNRLLWGSMIALATIADQRADEIWPHVEDIIQTVETGSVITTVWGIKTLAILAASGSERRDKIFPFLLEQLRTCIPRDVPTHAENMLCAVDDTAKVEFLAILASREPELSPAQLTRLKRVQRGWAPSVPT